MIKNTELRLGNFVKDRGDKVLRIDFMEHVQEGYSTKFGQLIFIGGAPVHPMTEYSDFANPILLTEEWLNKLGFRNYDVNKWDTDAMTILKYDEGCTYLANHLHVNLFYVHQLQNIYFALTGVELHLSST